MSRARKAKVQKSIASTSDASSVSTEATDLSETPSSVRYIISPEDGFSHYNAEFVDMYRVMTTCREMLLDRGYTISAQLANASIHDYYLLVHNPRVNTTDNDITDYDILGTKQSEKDLIVKIFREDESWKVKEYERYHKALNTNRDIRIIYVMRSRPINQVHERVTRDGDEYFLFEELIINRSHHRLVPKHTLLSDEEKNQVLKMYNASVAHMPRIMNTDFMARYFGAQKGQMFRIERPTPTSGFHTCYLVFIKQHIKDILIQVLE